YPLRLSVRRNTTSTRLKRGRVADAVIEAHLSLARAAQWLKKTLLLFALTHQFLQQIIEGDELYTRVKKHVAPDKSQGWTIVLMDRVSTGLCIIVCGCILRYVKSRQWL